MVKKYILITLSALLLAAPAISMKAQFASTKNQSSQSKDLSYIVGGLILVGALSYLVFKHEDSITKYYKKRGPSFKNFGEWLRKILSLDKETTSKNKKPAYNQKQSSPAAQNNSSTQSKEATPSTKNAPQPSIPECTTLECPFCLDEMNQNDWVIIACPSKNTLKHKMHRECANIHFSEFNICLHCNQPVEQGFINLFRSKADVNNNNVNTPVDVNINPQAEINNIDPQLDENNGTCLFCAENYNSTNRCQTLIQCSSNCDQIMCLDCAYRYKKEQRSDKCPFCRGNVSEYVILQ